MNKRIGIAMALLLLLPTGLAWYNDTGNDSCLTIYSDKELYRITNFDRNLKVKLLIDNQCGGDIADIDFGFYLTDAFNTATFNKISIREPSILTDVNSNRSCSGWLPIPLFEYDSRTTTATCSFTPLFDLNGQGTTIFWQHIYSGIDVPTKTITITDYGVETSKEFVDVTSTWLDKTPPAISISNTAPIKGWQSVLFKKGETRINVEMFIPYIDTDEKEFIFTAESRSDDSKTSVLDPEFFDVNYNSRFAINSMVISAKDDLNTTNTINLAGIDFTDLNMLSGTADDFTIVNEPDLVEVDDVNFSGWDGTGTDTDVNVYFKPTEGLVAGTWNGEYYIYTNSTSAFVPPNRKNRVGAVEDAEDNDNIADEPSYTYYNQNGGVVITTDAVAARNGGFGLKLVAAGANGYKYPRHFFTDATMSEISVSWWFMQSHASDNKTVILNTGEGALCQFGASNGSWVRTGGSFAANPVNDTWYKLVMNADFSADTCDFYLYDATETLIEASVGVAGGAGTPWFIYWEPYSRAAVTWYMDDLVFDIAYAPPYVLGPEEIYEPPVPDVNTALEFWFTNSTNYTFLKISGKLEVSKDVNVSGNLNVDGNYGAYGELWKSYSTEEIDLSTANTYYKIGDFNAGDKHKTTFGTDTNTIVVEQDGMYLVNISASFSGSVSTAYEFTLFKNGARDNGDKDIHIRRTTGTANAEGAIALTGLKALKATDYLDVRVEQTTGANKKMTLSNINFTITRIG